MIHGQMRDISSEGEHLSIEELKELHYLKTGALIEAATRTGANLGNGNMKQGQELGNYAKRIGLAFQVRDDILNVEGDPEIMGKAAGSDSHRNKNTFPALIGLEESKAYARALVNDALKILENFDRKADPLRSIASYIIERKK
jgi:geranylgeranyl diphosphate synthase type II